MQRAKLEALIEPAVVALGFEFVGYELLQQGHQCLIRIYIDSEKGVHVADCTKVSRQLSAVFDVEDPFSHSYYLEVSSPGIDRPLFTLEHYRRFIGQQVRFRTRLPQAEGQRRFKGILMGVENNKVTFKLEGMGDQLFEFSIDEIEKANIVANI